jgi:hypothetical protein
VYYTLLPSELNIKTKERDKNLLNNKITLVFYKRTIRDNKVPGVN